jgi:uncharacterized OsmC-like protein
VALGACTATDVVSILAKKRQKLDSLEVGAPALSSLSTIPRDRIITLP